MYCIKEQVAIIPNITNFSFGVCMCTVTPQYERVNCFLCWTIAHLIRCCQLNYFLLFFSREMWKIMVSSHFVFNKIFSMLNWISSVLCCGSLVQEKGER